MSRALRPATRFFSSSSVAQAAAGTSAGAAAAAALSDKPTNDIGQLKPFEFNDTTSHGYLRLAKMRQTLELVEKVEANHQLLQSQSRPFEPPTDPIQVTETIDLVWPKSSVNQRRSILAPVAKLPLKGDDAIHRAKVIAGPRWSPGRPGLQEMEYEEGEEGKHGWIKISENRFGSARMNRKSASDMLDRLIDAANDVKSPITSAIPVDTRHLVARQRRREKLDKLTNTQRQVLATRKTAADGFPTDWLSPEVKDKAKQARARSA